MAELYVGIENGQKKLIPTSSEARSGNPLGSFLLVYGNTVPIGYLPLETLFDENQYPALYAMLGTNKTPDTPCDLGADWDNAESITVSTSISYTAQENGWIVGSIYFGGDRATGYVNGVAVCGGDAYQGRNDGAISVQIRVNKGDIFTCTPSYIYASSSLSFVPFKKYAHVVIKATSGLEETQQDYVLQSLLEADSYSTEEVATGKKWIDGKMIYRKVLNYNVVNLPSQVWTSIVQDTMNIGTIIDICNLGTDTMSGRSVAGRINNGYIQMFAPYSWSSVGMIIEYTKAD